MGFELLHPTNDRDRWERVVERLPNEMRDVHWSPDYLAAEEWRGNMPRLATYTHENHVVCQPIIIRDIFLPDMPPELLETIRSLRDVSSPYGYGGPAASSPLLYGRFNEAFTRWANENRVVSEFCALHPFLLQHQLGMLKTARIAPTSRKQVVWMDLTGDFFNGYSPTRQHEVRKARKDAVVVRMDSRPDQFIDLYRMTMLRKRASARWWFPEEYLRTLCDCGTVWHATIGGVVHSAALMLLNRDGTAYYHLAANHDGARPGTNTLLVHEMAEFAARQGCKRFHLGGGSTSALNDGVMFFKSGFSALRAPAMSYFRVFDSAAYDLLCVEKKRREVAETGTEFGTVFEPLYRREAS